MPTFPTSLLNSTNTLTSHERNLVFNPPYTLNIPLDSLINPRRRRNKNQYSRPPRPSNPWIFFRTNFASRLRSQNSGNSYSIQDVSRIAGEDWKSQPIVVKQYFDALSKLALERHKETYSGYIYRPKRAKQNKRKNWLFREVDKAKFIERSIDENNVTKKKQERRANVQLDNSVQMNEDEQQSNCLEQNKNEQLQPYALLSDFVQQNKYEKFQASEEYALLDGFVQLTECRPIDESGQLNEYKQLPDEYTLLDHQIEYDQLNGYKHVEVSTLLGESLQLNEYDQFVGYGQRNEYAPLNEYYELVSYIDGQISESLLINELIYYDVHSNTFL
ncbi:5310_t:CDS:1 [Paraglomus brasilianum]|uniref:5310_t:CDS:1 n=1 Tax=Paraglomus brasilianum TaxID=144538 RepID=A0A9N9FFI7_9GLOM|nr:5310_t:CDS:1 [Paraglomus brasilianum]